MFLSHNNENHPQMLYKEKYFPTYPRKNTNQTLIFSCNFVQFRGQKKYHFFSLDLRTRAFASSCNFASSSVVGVITMP